MISRWEYGYTRDGWWFKKNGAILWGNKPEDIRDYLNALEATVTRYKEATEELIVFLQPIVHNDHGRPVVITDGVLYEDNFPLAFKLITGTLEDVK